MSLTFIQVDLGVDIHVMPFNDAIEHFCSDECICGPHVEHVQEADGSMGRLISHPSLLGDEADPVAGVDTPDEV